VLHSAAKCFLLIPSGAGDTVESAAFPKNRWNLTQEAFDLLLAQLDGDREQAGMKYEALRRRLVKFFEWRGCRMAEDLADDAMNRIARKLEAGEQISSLSAYCLGIARNVFLESLRERRREEALEPSERPSATQFDEPRQECLERCLRELPPQESSLIIEYYQEEKGSRIQKRRELAAHLGIPLNALRIRAHRIRAQLQMCVENCMQRFARE
jgi:RNA polymerase sigma factor (sigma-70 family)